MTIGIGWTPERVEQLRALAAQRKSASEIAAILRGGVTRNAVCGKSDRLGLTLGGDTVDHRPRVPRRRGTVTKPARKGPPWAPVLKEKPREPLPSIARRAPLVFHAPQPLPEPVSRNLPLADWTASTCKWIAGDGAAGLACGHPTDQATPYCAHHLRRTLARESRAA